MLELSLDTTVDLTRSAVRHGCGAFETLRITQGKPWRLDLHLERLAAGCAFLGLAAPPECLVVADFLNKLAVGTSLETGVLRLLAADGRLIVYAEPLASAPEPVALGLSCETVRFSGNLLTRFKTLSYLENLQLTREAARRGLFEVLAPNEQGYLTDGGRTTVFVVQKDRVLTSPVAAGALPGIARRVLLEAGYASEAPLRWEDLIQAEAVFLANALRGVLPVQEIEGQGRRNPEHPAISKARRLLEEK